jgi:hypothetical protein
VQFTRCLTFVIPSWEVHPEHELKSFSWIYQLIRPVQSQGTETRVTFPCEKLRVLQMWPEQFIHKDSLPPVTSHSFQVRAIYSCIVKHKKINTILWIITHGLFLKKIVIWIQVRYKKQLQKFPGIRWYNLQELPLWMNKCTLTSYVAVGMRSERNFPKNGETIVGFCFSTVLQHTGRFWSRIS